MRINKRKAVVLTAALAISALVLSGCGKYDTIDLPTVETAAADIVPESEETRPEEVQSSALKPEITTQTAPDMKLTDETVYVTGDKVNIRAAKSAASQSLGVVKKGDSLKRIGYDDSWSRVIYNDKECYISTQYVSLTLPETEPETTAAVANTGGKVIAIDPGHQGKGNNEKEPVGPGSSTMKAKVASGTQGTATKLPEYKLTLTVSQKLKAELEARGYQVMMIRENHDVNISNAERAEMANKSGADIFVRVHANSLNDSSVNGALTMCMTKNNPYNSDLYAKSSSLSRKVTDGISSTTGFKNRGVQETDSMSGINWCKIPVTIVEMGFMSNAEEDRKMATEEYQNKIAKGIADGIDAYYAAGN